MIDKDLLSTDPEIAAMYEHNKKYQGEMDRAMRLIAEDDRTRDPEMAKAACLKAFDAIVNGIKIFVSVGGGDAEFADKLVDCLNDADSGRRLCSEGPFPYMFRRSASRAIGEVYSQQILEALRQTHWMFIIVPSDRPVSGNVYWEIGAFDAYKTLVDKIICIHHQAISRMEIAQGYDQVSTTPEDLYRLFEHLFHKQDAMPGIASLLGSHGCTFPARQCSWLNERVVRPLVIEAARLRPRKSTAVMLQFEILMEDDLTENDAISRKDAEGHSEHRNFEGNGDNKINSIPEKVETEADADMKHAHTYNLGIRRVKGSEAVAQIFGWSNMPSTFDDLISRLEEKDPTYVVPWKINLAKQVEEISNGALLSANFVSFTDFQGHKRFRSSIISFLQREEPREVLSITVGLDESILYPTNRAPVDLEVLETAIRLAYRFRWEILERFQGRIDVRDIDTIESRLVAAERELMFRRVAGSQRIFELFEGDERKRMKKMSEEWLKMRAPDRTTGDLDIIFIERDQAAADRLPNILSNMRKMNNDFMLLAAPRFAELVRELWAKPAN